jgi:hypothetical protein
VIPDVRCDARSEHEPTSLRCQLYVGHEAEHAALVLRADHRTLRRWISLVQVTDVPFDAEVARLPWAPGLPSLERPAVLEPPALQVVASQIAPIRTPPSADLHIA